MFDLFGSSKSAVLIISPQRWDELPVSKHHYASELARNGHLVYFLEPQKSGMSLRRPILRQEVLESGHEISVVDWWLPLPYRLKFHAPWLYSRVAEECLRSILKVLPRPPDIVWDFDNTGMFTSYPSDLSVPKIWHLVDPPRIGKYKGQDITLATSSGYLDQIHPSWRPTALVPHGLRREFADYAKRVIRRSTALSPIVSDRPVVATFGNLSHEALDWETLQYAVHSNPSTIFLLIGPSDWQHAESNARANFERVISHENVRIRGRMEADEIIAMIPKISAWFLCYKSGSSVVGGLTSHKVLEFLATGLPIAMTGQENETYREYIHVSEAGSRQDFSLSISDALREVQTPGADARARLRAKLALDYTYSNHLVRIQKLVQSVLEQD